MEKILIIDNDKSSNDILKTSLEREGYTVLFANSDNDGMTKLKSLCPNIIMLEVTLKNSDGWQICREIRKISEIPIVFITAKNDIFDKLLGFEIGADDYITKPYDVREVILRIKAILRRTKNLKLPEESKELFYENLHINLTRYTLTVNGEVIETPPKELELLYLLASTPNRVYTRDQLLDEIWGFEYYGDSRTIDVHIKRLREKIDGVSEKWALKTVWGVGYKFESEQI